MIIGEHIAKIQSEIIDGIVISSLTVTPQREN